MTPAPAGRLVLSANSAWNLVNFRGGLIRALSAAGYEVVALTPDDPAAVRRLAGLGCAHVPLPMDGKGTSPARDLALLARFVRVLRRRRPDAYLGFTVKPNVYGSLAAHGLGIPVINTISGLGTAFIREDWLTRLVRRLYRAALARSHTVLFQNEDDLALFVGGGLVRRERTALLPGSGVDLDRFAPVPDGEGNARDGFRFLLAGRLLWDKGVGEYVEAARIVRREVPGAAFALLGFVEADNRTAVGGDVVRAWAADGIAYLGAVDDVRPHLAAADCVVLPSYREGAPRVLLEAAAMAKPLIATDVPGCRAVVEDGVNGFLCRVRDPADLARCMLAMLRLPKSQRISMGLYGRQKMESEFDEKIVTARYLTILNQLVTR